MRERRGGEREHLKASSVHNATGGAGHSELHAEPASQPWPWETLLVLAHLPKPFANILLMLPISKDNPFSPNQDLNRK